MKKAIKFLVMVLVFVIGFVGGCIFYTIRTEENQIDCVKLFGEWLKVEHYLENEYYTDVEYCLVNEIESSKYNNLIIVDLYDYNGEFVREECIDIDYLYDKVDTLSSAIIRWEEAGFEGKFGVHNWL